MRLLRGQVIELGDKRVKVDVDERKRLVKFNVEVKRKVEEAQPHVAVREIPVAEARIAGSEVEARSDALLELAPGFNVTDVRMRLTSLALRYGILSLHLTFQSEDATLSFTLRKPTAELLSKYQPLINLISNPTKDGGRKCR